MRCHAAEPGAVTSTAGSRPDADWRAGGYPSASARRLPPQGGCTGRMKGGTKRPPGSGCRGHSSGSEARPGERYKTPRWSAERRAPLRTGRNAHLRTVSKDLRCADRRSAPSPVAEKEERNEDPPEVRKLRS